MIGESTSYARRASRSSTWFGEENLAVGMLKANQNNPNDPFSIK